MTETVIVGLDSCGERLTAATVRTDGARLLVETIDSLTSDQLADYPPLRAGRAVFAVPDETVLVKHLNLPRTDSHDLTDLARFELAASMLESETCFAFDIRPTGLEDQYLGLVYRRRQLARLDDEFGFGHREGHSISGYRSRALALGLGYLNFCRQRSGDFVCLVDRGRLGFSICLVYRGKVVRLAYLPLKSPDPAGEADGDRRAMELKTVVSYQLVALAKVGITLPLSGLILSGETVEEKDRSVLARYFPTGVTAPVLHPGYFPERMVESGLSDTCLVPLGLTVN
jgi:hypothetical protein